jgi:hypothetical protein
VTATTIQRYGVDDEVEHAAKPQLKPNFTVRVTLGVPVGKEVFNGLILPRCGLQ